MAVATQVLGARHAASAPAAPVARQPRGRGARFGGYDVVAPIAHGGMSSVYLAVHRKTGARVALKALDAMFANHTEVVNRLLAEHVLASRTQHPGVVEIRGGAWTTDRVPYLVMEYLEGETLGAIAERGTIAGRGTSAAGSAAEGPRGLIDLPWIVAICAQAAAALAALHEVGVIHCDVKHDNLFVLNGTALPFGSADRRVPAPAVGHHINGWPRVKVIDFGVSRLVDEPTLDDPTVAGTPTCIAPEQWRGKPGTASDVYAVGCLLYELTTGEPPFDGSLPELMNAHLERRPARPSWLRPMPIALERLILRSLAKHPSDRPTMRDLAIELALLSDALRIPLPITPAQGSAIFGRSAGVT